MSNKTHLPSLHEASKPAKQEAITRPLAPPAGVANVIHLQRTAGNTAVNRLIQAKLTIGAANDPLEREADRIADRVASGGNTQTQPVGAQGVHRNAAEEDELMTKRGTWLGAFDAGPAFEQQLSSAGGGKPLDPNTRSEMERGIGADFSNVRVHTGAHASQLNRSISAQAFTRGSDVFFDSGKYNPASAGGKHLLAHELTHVVQQGGARQGVQRKLQRNTGPAAYMQVIQRALDGQEKTQWQDVIFDYVRNTQNARRENQNDRATSELNSLIRHTANLAYALMDAPNTKGTHIAQVNQLFASLTGLAGLGQGGGYVKSGKYEKQNMRLKNASYKSAVASGLFFHKEQMYKKDQDGDGYLEQLNGDDYGKRTLYHAAGGLMNLAFPVSLLGIMGGSAITKMRALATRSTERTLSSDRNAIYGAPLANFRNALETIEGMATGNGPLLASCKQVRRSLEAFLKKRNAQHENVTKNQNGTIAENVSSNWMTKNLLKGVFNPKAYGPK